MVYVAGEDGIQMLQVTAGSPPELVSSIPDLDGGLLGRLHGSIGEHPETLDLLRRAETLENGGQRGHPGPLMPASSGAGVGGRGRRDAAHVHRHRDEDVGGGDAAAAAAVASAGLVAASARSPPRLSAAATAEAVRADFTGTQYFSCPNQVLATSALMGAVPVDSLDGRDLRHQAELCRRINTAVL